MVINPIVGVYMPMIRIPIKGWMTIPNIATFDHGTYVYIFADRSEFPRANRNVRILRAAIATANLPGPFVNLPQITNYCECS